MGSSGGATLTVGEQPVSKITAHIAVCIVFIEMPL